MISQLKTSILLRSFLKNFLLTLLAFSIPITIQFGFILSSFETHLLIMPLVFSILVASLMGWNGVLRNKLEHNNQLKNEFLSSVSHELRNPLTVVNGYSRILSVAEDVPEDKQEYANRIYIAGNYLLSIISDLQDISRIESGKMLISIKNLLLNNELQQVLPMLKAQTDEHGIKIKVLSFNHELVILADEQRLQQVLINLISNAIKYGNDDTNIEIKVEEINDKVRITIIDQGPGISKDKLSQLFIPFNRIGAEQTSVKGTGIGLALSKRLIEIMDGEIGVSSVVNEGSRFWITLPKA